MFFYFCGSFKKFKKVVITAFFISMHFIFLNVLLINIKNVSKDGKSTHRP
ncbi:hypothetical protein AAJ76_3700023020 [Vairimorpha ceranae]|uniref:Uncharacterized protein n=1 Tax=Vairimorpha ceranae TaxID=40302 RepID=A0A0F9WBT0_9MICR|nr:hypothetical protein AAJ76_3700023020 [Vairimorpha ceranae]KKO74971.1 hypothetical protein AAJ76_3700023020 [Vairimorpha ceranae]